MNLICCNASCKHQEDGYCTLEKAEFVSSQANEDCCFFETNLKPKKKAPKG